MKYAIKYSKKFKKSYKKLSVEEQEIADKIIDRLANDEILEEKYYDHKLKGEFKNFRECHLKPDLLLIYQKQDDILILYCFDIGSHSGLF